MLVHKGFIGHIDYDMSSGIIVGEVINAPDVILFQGKTANSVRQAFEASIEDYLAFRQQCHEAPNIVPFCSPISVHLRPGQHNKVMSAAKAADKSVNDWCSEALESAANHKQV